MQESGPEEQTTRAPQDEATPQEEMLSSLEQQLAEIKRQKQECLDSLLRTQADFVNYKRRAAQEQKEARMAAQGALLETLLPILDDLGRALESAPAELAQQSWMQGIHLVARRLTTTLQRLGVQSIGAPGEPFDPHRHEAVMTERRSDVPEGTIVQVTRPGYAQGGQIFRPAQVVVAAAPEATTATPSEK